MSSGLKQGLTVAPEATAGVLPIPFDRQRLRHKTCSIDGEPSSTPSEELTEEMMSQGEFKTGISFGGEITGEVSYGTYDGLLASAFHNDWVNNELVLSSLRKTFSMVREYRDSGGYHIFRGLIVTGFSLTIPEEGLIEVTFNLQGTNREPVTFTVPAGTIAPPTTTLQMTNVGVGDITIDGQSMQDVACITALTLNIEFSVEAQKCLGKGLSVGKLLETGVTVGGTVTLAWGDEAASLNELKFTDTAISIVAPISDEAGNTYTISIPEATCSGSLPSGARGDILSYELAFTARRASPKIVRTPAVP